MLLAVSELVFQGVTLSFHYLSYKLCVVQNYATHSHLFNTKQVAPPLGSLITMLDGIFSLNHIEIVGSIYVWPFPALVIANSLFCKSTAAKFNIRTFMRTLTICQSWLFSRQDLVFFFPHQLWRRLYPTILKQIASR